MKNPIKRPGVTLPTGTEALWGDDRADSSDDEPPDPGPAPKTRSVGIWAVPVVVVALIGLVSAVVSEPLRDYVSELINGGGDRFAEFSKKNEACTRVPGDLFDAPGGIKIASTICSATGDIYLAFYYNSDGKPQTKYAGIFLQEAIKEGASGVFVAGSGAADATTAWPGVGFSGLGAAFALPTTEPYSEAPPVALEERLAQDVPTVQCTAFPPDGTIVRKVQSGQGCFMETIDGNSGLVISTVPVDCATPCP